MEPTTGFNYTDTLIANHFDDENATCLDPMMLLIQAEEDQHYDADPQPLTTQGNTMNDKPAKRAPKGFSKLITGSQVEQADVVHIGNEQFDRSNIATERTMILTNIDERLEQLAGIAPSVEFFAGSAIVGSLGYTIINALMWNYRKTANAVEQSIPTIDIFNDSYAEKYEDRSRKEAAVDNGFMELPQFDAAALAGVYKNLLRKQIGNAQFNGKYPTRMPDSIISEMQNPDNERAAQVAHAAIINKEIDASPAAAAIRNAAAIVKPKFDAHKADRNKGEAEHVLRLLQCAMPEALTDDIWSSIPLHVQYKLTMFLYTQLAKQLAVESQINSDSDAFHVLLDLINEIHLELEAASRTSEVRYAFAIGRLTEKHELVKGSMPSRANGQANLHQLMAA